MKSFVHNINEEIKFIFNISFDMSIYYRIYWCRCLRRCFRHWSIACFISFLWLLLVERLLIIHYRLNVSYHYYSFVVISLKVTFLLLLSANRKYVFQSKSFVWISIAWNFQSVTFLMQFIKRNFWWHTCLSHFLRNWFDSKVCCASLF